MEELVTESKKDEPDTNKVKAMLSGIFNFFFRAGMLYKKNY
jgi:hypothetical protein